MKNSSHRNKNNNQACIVIGSCLQSRNNININFNYDNNNSSSNTNIFFEMFLNVQSAKTRRKKEHKKSVVVDSK